MLRPPRVRAAGQGELAPTILIWLLGFAVAFPGLLLPGQAYSPRYTDLVVVLCIPFVWSIYNRAHRGERALTVSAFWLSVLVVAAGAQYLSFHVFGVADATYYFRWIAAVLLAAPLAWIMPGRQDLQRLFLIGVVSGAALHLVTIWVALLGGTSFLRAVGWASARVVDTSYNGEARVTSLAEHPNYAMILLAFAVPAAMGHRLIWPPNRGWIMLIASLIILVFGFYFTLTRSAMLAAIGSIAVAILQFFKRSEKSAIYFRATYIILAIIIVILAIQLSQYQIGQDRLMDRVESKGLGQNLEGRADTISATIDLLIKYPLGVGWSTYLQMGTLADHLRASHNGYLFTARLIGIPVALLLIAGHIRVLWRTVSTRRIDALPPLASFFVAVMFAEDVTQGMPMVFVATFIAMCGFQSQPWASTIYRSVLLPPANAARRSPPKTTGR